MKTLFIGIHLFVYYFPRPHLAITIYTHGNAYCVLIYMYVYCSFLCILTIIAILILFYIAMPRRRYYQT